MSSPYVNTNGDEHITRHKTLSRSKRAPGVQLSRVQRFFFPFGSVFTQLVSLFVRAEAEIAASVLSEDRLSRSTHATLSRDREVRASSWLHSSPHLTLYGYKCKLYITYFCVYAGMKLFSQHILWQNIFSFYFSYSPSINYSVCLNVAYTKLCEPPKQFPNLSSPSEWKVYHLGNTSTSNTPRALTISQPVLKKKKKSQLDENKHMLFVNLKRRTNLAKYHRCQGPSVRA